VTSSAIGWLALPVAGPFLAAATVPKLNPAGPVDDRAFRSIMIADGALQATSLGLLVLAGATAKPAFVTVPRRREPRDPCEPVYTAAAKYAAEKGPDDLRIVPVATGALMLILLHPLAEILAVGQSHDHARLWALLPGPGPIVAAATLNPKAVPGPQSQNARLGFAVLGGAEIASLGLMASAPLWKHPADARLPDVKIGAGSASLTWKF
jgi:hypothetical protein